MSNAVGFVIGRMWNELLLRTFGVVTWDSWIGYASGSSFFWPLVLMTWDFLIPCLLARSKKGLTEDRRVRLQRISSVWLGTAGWCAGTAWINALTQMTHAIFFGSNMTTATEKMILAICLFSICIVMVALITPLRVKRHRPSAYTETVVLFCVW